jgi:ATP-dependent protease Clp ATPase subunit
MMQTNFDTKPQCAWYKKSQDAVAVLIANPTDVHPRSYICDECVAVCDYVLENHRQDRSEKLEDNDSSHVAGGSCPQSASNHSDSPKSTRIASR